MKIHGGDDIYTFKGFESSNIVICDRKSKSLLLKNKYQYMTQKQAIFQTKGDLLKVLKLQKYMSF